MKFVVLLFVLGAAVACTKPNPATCCLDSADCAAAGFDGIRECAAGLACVNHECEVPKCSTTGCAAEQPVCNITTDVCEGCMSSMDCDRFDVTPTCDTSNGACVECVTSADCATPTKAICDNKVCRGCQKDSECLSGACGDDGACVSESAIVYLDAGGNDTGTCTRSAPCRSLGFAVSKTATTREHIVMAPGAYAELAVLISNAETNAERLYLHGHGAVIAQTGGDGTLIGATIPFVIRDLDLTCVSGGECLNFANASVRVEDVTVRGANNGMDIFSQVTVRRFRSIGCRTGILLSTGGQLDLDGGVFEGGLRAISAGSFGVNVNIANAVVWGTSDLGLDLERAAGTVTFTTVADAGADAGTGPRAVSCNANVTVRSSIIWAPGVTTRAPMGTCNVVSTIAGPTAVPGAMNVNPQFVDATNHDYHIASTSPAHDAVDTGPTTDFEGDARPRGVKFDIGADEAP